MNPRTLMEKVTDWMRHDANKHALWQDAHDSVDEYVEAQVNRMTPYQLLEAISMALQDG